MQSKNSLSGNFEMLIATLIWGSTFIVVKKTLPYVNAITLNVYRFALASLVIGFMLVFLRKHPWRHLKEGLFLGLLSFCAFAAQNLGLYLVSAASSGFIISLFVVFVAVLSIVLGYEKFQLNMFVATVLVVGGVWNITGGVKGFNWGTVLTLSSALFFALYLLYASRVVKKCDIWVLNFQQFFVVTFFSLICVLAFKLPFTVASKQTMLWILYLVLFATIWAFLIQLRTQKIITPTACAILLSLEPVFAAILAWTVGGESFDVESVIGGALIVVAIIVSQTPWVWRKQADLTPS